MREDKFRAWDIVNKKMLYNVMVGGFEETVGLVYSQEKCEWVNLWADNKDGIKMQYIGLKDNNGKEAYHKDEVSALGYSNWTIEWHNNGWKLKQEDIENYQEIPNDFIIIGYIYENLESLEDKK